MDVAEIGVAVDGSLGFMFGVGEQAGGRLVSAVPIYEAGVEAMWADGGAGVPLFLQMQQFFDVAAHIANAGDTTRNV